MDNGFQGTPYEYWLLTEYNGSKSEIMDLNSLSAKFGEDWVVEFSRIMNSKSNVYEGDNINIEEMPQGCVISPVGTDGRQWMEYDITVSSTRDALALIDSLQKMITVQKGE